MPQRLGGRADPAQNPHDVTCGGRPRPWPLGGRPHDVTKAPPLRNEFGPGVHFIPVLIPNILNIARAAPRRPSRAEPLQPPPRPRRPPRAPTKHFADSLPPCGAVRAVGPGPGAAASRDRPCSEAPPPHPPLPGAAGSSSVRPGGPGAGTVLGRGRVAQPGDREPGTERRAGEAAPKFALDAPGAAEAPFAEVSWRAGRMLGAGGARGAGAGDATRSGCSFSRGSALCATSVRAGAPRAGAGPRARLPAPLSR